MNRLNFNDDQIKQIIDLYKTGVLQKDIATMFNSSKSTIGRILREHGITSKVTLSENDISDIVYQYNNGFNIDEIAKMHNVGGERVSKILKYNNVKIRTANVYNRKYTLNEQYFDVVDTQEKAYILGLLFADGYISESNNCISISLKEDDVDVLLKINEEIKSNRPLSYLRYNDKNKNWSNQYKLSINSAYMVNSLRKLGLFQNKSMQIEFPLWLQDEYYFHFLRGYIDGDGCIMKTEKRLTIISTESFCNSISQYLLEKLNVHCSISLCHKNKEVATRDLRISGAKQVKTVLDKVYEDANIYLDRKYQIYKAIYLNENINNSLSA